VAGAVLDRRAACVARALHPLGGQGRAGGRTAPDGGDRTRFVRGDLPRPAAASDPVRVAAGTGVPAHVRATGQGFTYNFGRGVGALFPAEIGFSAQTMGVGGAMVFAAAA
jgi:hypothetical protein